MLLGAFVVASYERREILATPTWPLWRVTFSLAQLFWPWPAPGVPQREPDHRVTKTKALLLLLSVHKCETGAKMDKNLPWDYVLWAANNVEEPPGLLLPQQRCNKARSWKNAWRFNRNWTAWVIIIFQVASVPQFYTFWFACLCFLSYLGGAHFELSFLRRSHKHTLTPDHKAKVSLQLRWCSSLNEQQRRIKHSFCQAFPLKNYLNPAT